MAKGKSALGRWRILNLSCASLRRSLRTAGTHACWAEMALSVFFPQIHCGCAAGLQGNSPHPLCSCPRLSPFLLAYVYADTSTWPSRFLPGSDKSELSVREGQPQISGGCHRGHLADAKYIFPFVPKLGWKFYDADDYHSEENRIKMGKGVPLSDQVTSATGVRYGCNTPPHPLA